MPPAPDPRELIREKRDGYTHDPAALTAFIAAYARGEVADYQASAWLMAAFLKGLDETETQALTRALLDSGRRFDWSALGRPSADKHSTGGVGDKVSLILAPLVAACGVMVPMVSGRGLGHTGGTLDKLESIPGFKTRLSPEAMRAQLDSIGVVMVGQGPDLAPADGKLYALRDVTATVEFEPFIVSSIVSKKIAEGAGAVVYDVKFGNGAFMRSIEAARSLARRLVATTRGLGAKASAFITDMNQPLGVMAGNALEVRESIDMLRGVVPGDLHVLTFDLAARMLELAGVVNDRESGIRLAHETLFSGAAWEKFVAMVEAQGGDVASVEHPERLPRAPVIAEVKASHGGIVEAVNTFDLGELVVAIGGGRRAKEDEIDPRVGLETLKKTGDHVFKGEPLARLHLASDEPGAVARAASCFFIVKHDVKRPKLVLERVD